MQVRNRHRSVGAHNVQLHVQRKVSSGDIMVKRVIVGRDTLHLPSGGRIEDALNVNIYLPDRGVRDRHLEECNREKRLWVGECKKAMTHKANCKSTKEITNTK